MRRNPAGAEWQRAATSYLTLTRGDVADSRFLREQCLFPTLVRLVKKSHGSRVLDIGAGDNSLAALLPEYEIFPIDIVSANLIGSSKASLQDAERLGFRDGSFDVGVLSLVLMWLSSIEGVCSEVRRVIHIGGSVVIALVSPYFYRTGEVLDTGSFLVTRDLSREFVIRDLHIADFAGPLTYYYRPLHSYLNALIGAGFKIEEVKESFIDMASHADFAKNRKLLRKRTGRVPIYSFVRCTRSE